MKLAHAIATLAALTVAGTATAANLVTNGSFENGYTVSTQFNQSIGVGMGPTGWTSAGTQSYNLYVDPATVTTVETITQSSEAGQKLALSFPGASPDGGKFVILDGDEQYNGVLSQMINGTVTGKTYAVKFYWGASQLQDRSGPTTERLEVGFGGAPTQTTATLSTPSQGFEGWFAQTFKFTATGSSQLLTFLSHGTPYGLPPVAVLDGVSVTAVPEPAMWGMMIVGFGLVGFAARRRAAVVAA